MKKTIKIVSVILICLVALVFIQKYISNTKKSNDFNLDIENVIMEIYKGNDEKILENLNNAFEKDDDTIYIIVNNYLDDELRFEFYKDKFNISKGYSEFNIGLLNILNDNEEEGIKNIESSIKQGNIEATYFLAEYFKDRFIFSKSFENYEKAYESNYLHSIPIYEEMLSDKDRYFEMEKLHEKYKNKEITKEERKELGEFIVEKDDFLDVNEGYNIMKPFIREEDENALYLKASVLEMDGSTTKAKEIFELLYNKYGFDKALKKLVNLLPNKTRKDKEQIIKMLTEVDEKTNEIKYLLAEQLFENDRWSESKQYFDELLEAKYKKTYSILGKYYSEVGNKIGSIKMYKRSVDAGYVEDIMNLIEAMDEIDTNELIKIDELKTQIHYAKKGIVAKNGIAAEYLSKKSNNKNDKVKYALISIAYNNMEGFNILLEVSSKDKEKNKEKIRVYTNLILNKKYGGRL